jgi:Cu-Zn family superoxide dismutase
MKLVHGSIAVAAVIVGCATMAPSRNEAVAELAPTAGNNARGTVTFSQKDGTVLVVAKLSGLTSGSHGFHVHEKGDCSAADAMSAGGHFNPLGKPHAHPSSTERHTGDMPTLVADASGNATLTTELDLMRVGDGANDIVGKSVVVHKDPDDFTTQPAGNSGPRVACGVIRKV